MDPCARCFLAVVPCVAGNPLNPTVSSVPETLTDGSTLDIHVLTGDEVRRAERGPHGKHGVLAHAKLRHFALDGDAVFGKVSAMRRVHLFGFTRTRAQVAGKTPRAYPVSAVSPVGWGEGRTER